MAWSEATILARAREFVKIYADDAGLSNTDVRSAFEQFCTDTLAIPVTDQFTTTANQREYALVQVIQVEQVKLGSQKLVQGRWPMPNSYRVDAGQIVLQFDPPAGVTLTVEGYGVPASISEVTLQPESNLQDAVAYLCAARYLSRYGDAQAVSRASVYHTYYELAVQSLRRRRGQAVYQRGDKGVPIRRRLLIGG